MILTNGGDDFKKESVGVLVLCQAFSVLHIPVGLIRTGFWVMILWRRLQSERCAVRSRDVYFLVCRIKDGMLLVESAE